MKYQLVPGKKGYNFICDDDGDYPRKKNITPNLQKNELKIKTLKTKDCPKDSVCISLISDGRISNICE